MELSLMLLLITLIVSLLSNLILVLTYRRSQRKVAFMQATIIKQKEKIQELVHKGGNKSLEFASAGHDICNAMLVITGLIDLCRDGIDVDNNLIQMRDCASKLLGIIKAVLDSSKVEAGKMQLEEVEFDMAQVLEESVDLCHVMAHKKGINIIWDPCDFTVMRNSRVKGDCRRLKQILDNLLGNAVKFTSQGHVSLRAWCQKPNHEKFENRSSRKVFSFVSKYILKERAGEVDTSSSLYVGDDYLEFIFEVDDTGVGIPKEKRASAFESYIQIKEPNNRGHEGTGLGLGIVKSYVQLMGGDIRIKDKVQGEKGTCFRFNIFLKASDNETNIGLPTQLEEMEGFHSLLLVSADETRRVLSHFLENIGTKVHTLNHQELENLVSDNIAINIEQGSSTCILVFVDINCGVSENVLNTFSRKFRGIRYKVIWLVNPDTPYDSRRGGLVLKKPIHGSRLFKILKSIREIKGNEESSESKPECSNSKPSRDQEKPLNGLNILLAEDAIPIQRINQMLLTRAGANITIASNGVEAFELVKKALREAINEHDKSGKDVYECFSYNIILMDTQMPVMDGYEATRKIRAELSVYDINIPIFSCTAFSSAEEEKEAILAGMTSQLSKTPSAIDLKKAYDDFVSN